MSNIKFEPRPSGPNQERMFVQLSPQGAWHKTYLVFQAGSFDKNAWRFKRGYAGNTPSELDDYLSELQLKVSQTPIIGREVVQQLTNILQSVQFPRAKRHVGVTLGIEVLGPNKRVTYTSIASNVNGKSEFGFKGQAGFILPEDFYWNTTLRCVKGDSVSVFGLNKDLGEFVEVLYAYSRTHAAPNGTGVVQGKKRWLEQLNRDIVGQSFADLHLPVPQTFVEKQPLYTPMPEVTLTVGPLLDTEGLFYVGTTATTLLEVGGILVQLPYNQAYTMAKSLAYLNQVEYGLYRIQKAVAVLPTDFLS